MNLIDAIKEKLGLSQRNAYPITYAAPLPQRIPPVAVMGPSADLSSSESASLVSSSGHKSGTSSDNRASLISGR